MALSPRPHSVQTLLIAALRWPHWCNVYAGAVVGLDVCGTIPRLWAGFRGGQRDARPRYWRAKAGPHDHYHHTSSSPSLGRQWDQRDPARCSAANLSAAWRCRALRSGGVAGAQRAALEAHCQKALRRQRSGHLEGLLPLRPDGAWGAVPALRSPGRGPLRRVAASGTGGAESDGGAGVGESAAESPAAAPPTTACNQRVFCPARRRSESGAESLR